MGVGRRECISGSKKLADRFGMKAGYVDSLALDASADLLSPNVRAPHLGRRRSANLPYSMSSQPEIALDYVKT